MPSAAFKPVEILGAEHHPVVGRDVDQIEVDAGLGDGSGEVGQRAGTVFDVDDHDLALAADDGLMGDGQGVPRGFGVWYEDVQLGTIAHADTGRRGEVDTGVTDCGRDLGERARPVVDLDDQIHRHELPPVSRGVILSLRTRPVVIHFRATVSHHLS